MVSSLANACIENHPIVSARLTDGLSRCQKVAVDDAILGNAVQISECPIGFNLNPRTSSGFYC
jgi:hypothetical protein